LGEPLISTTRQGTKDTGSEDTGKFPFEAFEFTLPSGSAPVLTLRSPWTLTAGVTGNVTGDVTGFASENAPQPQAAAGVGQVMIRFGANGDAINAPAGGTWWVISGYYRSTTTSLFQEAFGVDNNSMLIAGGAQILAGVGGFNACASIMRYV
jgi:hypothetical protein